MNDDVTARSTAASPAAASRSREGSIDDVGRAVGFLVAHNLDVCGARRPSTGDIEASLCSIKRVVEIMGCSYVELAVKFGMKRLHPAAAAEPASGEGVKGN